MKQRVSWLPHHRHMWIKRISFLIKQFSGKRRIKGKKNKQTPTLKHENHKERKREGNCERKEKDRGIRAVADRKKKKREDRVRERETTGEGRSAERKEEKARERERDDEAWRRWAKIERKRSRGRKKREEGVAAVHLLCRRARRKKRVWSLSRWSRKAECRRGRAKHLPVRTSPWLSGGCTFSLQQVITKRFEVQQVGSKTYSLNRRR